MDSKMKVDSLPIGTIVPNEGQVEGLPRNPRFIRDEKFEALKRSIEEDPEMLQMRPVMVYPYNGEYIAIGGNMRLAAMRDLGYDNVPCVIIPSNTPADKLRAYTMKDNYGYGEWDASILAEDWDMSELDNWDMNDIIGFDLSETEVEGQVNPANTLSDNYSQNIGHVEYEPKNTNHSVKDLYEVKDFTKEISKIENKELRDFFNIRAKWFCTFNFSKIADYYAYQATPEEQRVFEMLGLVLLDKDQMLENGFANIVNDIQNEEFH